MPYLTPSEGAKLVKLFILGMLVQLLVIGYVFFTGYQGRKTQVEAVRAGCERGKLSNSANAEGWRIAQDARFQSGDISVSVRYGQLATELERRAQINCQKAYPKASLLP